MKVRGKPYANDNLDSIFSTEKIYVVKVGGAFEQPLDCACGACVVVEEIDFHLHAAWCWACNAHSVAAPSYGLAVAYHNQGRRAAERGEA